MSMIKRIFEILVAIFLLIIFLLPSAMICLVIYYQTNQFPIFVQLRGVLINNKLFKIYKFRTIKEGKDGTMDIYPFGKLLRETGFDEIPQLINIIKGDMAFIGPRPLNKQDLCMLKTYKKATSFEQNEIEIKPGITGWWQLNRYNNNSIKYLFEAEKYYIEHKSLLFDLKIIWNTILLFMKRGNKESSISAMHNVDLADIEIHGIFIKKTI